MERIHINASALEKPTVEPLNFANASIASTLRGLGNSLS